MEAWTIQKQVWEECQRAKDNELFLGLLHVVYKFYVIA